jgi:hypothetical protein
MMDTVTGSAIQRICRDGVEIDLAVLSACWAAAAGHDDDTIRSEALDLGEQVRSNLPPQSSLRRYFDGLSKAFESESLTVKRSIEAKAVFFSLPADQQRQILNGWKPCMEMIRVDEWAETCGLNNGGAVMQRCMRIAAGPKGIDACRMSFNNLGEGRRVSVTIPEGMTQEEVARALLSASQMVVRRWQEMVDLNPDSCDVLQQSYGETGMNAEGVAGQIRGMVYLVESVETKRQRPQMPTHGSQACRRVNHGKAGKRATANGENTRVSRVGQLV